MTKAMEGFLKRHPTARLKKQFDERFDLMSYIFTDDSRGLFDKKSVSRKTLVDVGEEKVEAAYTKEIERRFYL